MSIELITNFFAISLVIQFILLAIYLKTKKLNKIFEWINWLSLIAMSLYYFKQVTENIDSKLGIPFFLILITILLLNILFKKIKEVKT